MTMKRPAKAGGSASSRPTLLLIVFGLGCLAGSIVTLSTQQVLVLSSLSTTSSPPSLSGHWRTEKEDSTHIPHRIDADDNDKDGWATIHVFLGTNITQRQQHMVDASVIPNEYYQHLLEQQQQQQQQQQQTRFGHNLFNNNNNNNNNNHLLWFAQLRQDQLVSHLLSYQREGYFVDLAANDAIRISNTYALEWQLGWKGLCLEPNSQYWPGLAYRRHCQVIGAVVGGGSGQHEEVQFQFSRGKGPMSGIVGFDNAPNGDTSNIPQVELQRRFAVPLHLILKKFGAPRVIDYLSLDVEGAEALVLQGFDFDAFQFSVLTIERPSADLQSTLTQNDYVLIRQLHKYIGETLWVHSSLQVPSNVVEQVKTMEIPKYRERYRGG